MKTFIASLLAAAVCADDGAEIEITLVADNKITLANKAEATW